MFQIKQIIRTHLSCCLHCGSFRTETGLLCRPCSEALDLYAAQPRVRTNGTQMWSLYEWQPGQSDMLSSLILNLKGGYNRQAWEHYAKLLAKKRWVYSHSEISRPMRIVPAPARSEGAKDHAVYWALSLAHEMSAEFTPCLRRTTHQHQRKMDRGARGLLTLELNEKYTGLFEGYSNYLWIFADDVLTTGSTAQAAYEALGKPPHFEIWTLARRGSLAERP